MQGLYDEDFAGFRLPSSDEVDAAVRDAVVAIDANVLLSLYRFRDQTAADLLTVFHRLGDRLVVPHQAVREFWRHRQRAPGSPNAATSAAMNGLAKGCTTMTQAIETWAKQIGLDPEERAGLVDRLQTIHRELRQAVSAEQQDLRGGELTDDPILK